MTARALLACVGLLAFGCGELDPELGPERVPAPAFDRVEPDGGAEPDTPCEVVDSDPDTDVLFADVSTVFRGFCSCHVEPGGVGQTLGGLDLASHAGALAGGRQGGPGDVVPGDPCRSQLVAKLGDDPPFGSRMPFSRAPLTPDNRQLIVDWIVEGARP